MEDVLYIYNIDQCNFYIENGVKPIKCGVNDRTKKVWLKFVKEDTKEVYLLWLKRCKDYKNNKR